jgi:hypothetical protein
MRAGVGLSREPSSAAAGRDAAAAALADVDGLQPALVVVFASHTHDLPALTAAVSATVHAAAPGTPPGSVPVVGAAGCGIVVVAEGVELPEQSSALHEAGCRQFQGWLYAPARPAAELADAVCAGRVYAGRAGGAAFGLVPSARPAVEDVPTPV